MCVRFLIEHENEEMKPFVNEALVSPLADRFRLIGRELVTAGEVRPTDVAPVIARSKRGDVHAFPMKWGFDIGTRAPIVNARIETASEKAAFRDSYIDRRCLIPASCYFEWEHIPLENGKTKAGAKYAVHKDSGLIFLCGLYRFEKGLPVFTVLTREPGEELKHLHDRMPLILPNDCSKEWLEPGRDPSALIDASITMLQITKCG